MKKFFLIMILGIITFSLFAQNPPVNNEKNLSLDELNKEFFKFRNELDAVKKDVEILKEKTEWFSFKIGGYIKTIYGVNVWAKPGYGFDSNTPITHGFDFENRIRMQMILGNKTLASSKSYDDLGTEISISLKIKSKGISEIKPEGSWYVVPGRDDQGNTVDIYLPRNEAGSSNVVFGNYQIVLEEAKVKNILGTGFFVNYQDVTNVHKYYGATGLSEILKLNHEYFNNGYILDENDIDKFASLYYSFDAEYYEPESHVTEAMNLWSNSMLRTDPSDLINGKYNQRPHGISLGYSADLSEGFNLFIEAGAASKDAFDPKYFEDENIDYGFFLRAEPRLHNDVFEFHPKLSLSYAFQTDTTRDMSWPWSTFAGGLSLPFKYMFNKNDYVNLELNYNMNVHIVTAQFANIISFAPELSVLNKKLKFSLPLIYSFKNSGRSGFQRIGNVDVKFVDQKYDDHIFNLGFISTFDSNNLFGDIFQYRLINTLYFTLMLPYHNGFYSNVDIYPGSERYFFEILRNEFIINNTSVDKITVYLETGLGYLNNAKLIDSSTILKYEYNRNRDTYSEAIYKGLSEWKVWSEAVVLSLKTGFDIDLIKNFSVGFSAESPKLYIDQFFINHFYAVENGVWFGNQYNILGNQQSYGLYKLHSTIRF